MSSGWIVAFFCLGAASATCVGQADYAEDFDGLDPVAPCGDYGPDLLESAGWIFRMQSESSTCQAFDDGASSIGWPVLEGGYLGAVGSASWGVLSNWAILPAVPDQIAGDVITLWVFKASAASPRIEVRYSPSGGISTGSGAAAVGDFTELLLDIEPNATWTSSSVEVPGNGRIALRHRGSFVSSFGMRIGIDRLTVGPPQKCNDCLLLPEPGETVTWTSAMSPIVVDVPVTVPGGGTIIVEPGAVIEVQGDGALFVEGELIAHGTAEQLITINTPSSWFPYAGVEARRSGLLDLKRCRINGTLEADASSVELGEPGPAILAEDCQIINGRLRTEDLVSGPQFISVDGCTFSGSAGGFEGLHVQDGQLYVRNSTFQAPSSIRINRGFLYIDNVTIDGETLSFSRQFTPQPVYINRVTVMNSPQAALRLGEWSYLLGPENVLQNNLYPVEISNAGLLPGTVVPDSGNSHNYVLADGGKSIWAPLAVPYVVPDLGTIGALAASLTILPGTTVQFLPGGGFVTLGSLFAEGLPGEPIIFQPRSSEWIGLIYDRADKNKLEHCVVEGAGIGVTAIESDVWIENCLLQNNATGSNSNTFGTTYLAKTQVLDNGTGVRATDEGSVVMPGDTNINWIEGNGQGVIQGGATDTLDARFNWWGDRTGPMHPDNPGGQGDSAGFNVLIHPFRTAPPDLSDHPPVVRLQRHSSSGESGEKIIISWDAFDDGEIVAQRLLFADHGYVYEVLVDDIAPEQRSVAVTVPVLTPSSQTNASVFRVVAVDDSGQVGMDQIEMFVRELAEVIDITTDLSGPFTPGDHFDQLESTGGHGFPSYFMDVGTEGRILLGVGLLVDMPFVSSDLVRIGVAGDVDAFGTPGRGYSEYFTIRPDARIGDEPPVITLTSPSSGSFEGGSVVPVAWTASDDESVRSIDIQATYDGGRTWHFLADDLPGDVTAFDWQLPPLEQEIDDVHVRVVAVDLRFQSSSGTSGALSLTPGAGAVPGDLDGDGSVGFSDLLILLAAWGACPAPSAGCPADLDESGDVGFNDLLILLAGWS